uniref:MD-2-related lipid-recognition domain-containing protein n=1 Tax=Plectus sambesii TaxID=2011161 RepID=A0A914VRI0_9BILA
MTLFYSLSLLLLSLVAMAGAEYRSIKYKDCKSAFEIIDVQADQCPGDHNYCPFLRGTRPRIRIAFKPNREVKSFDASVRARLAGVSVPFNLEEPNACQNSNITCPLQADQIYYYSQTVHILENYPKVSVQVNWLINDPSNDETEAENKREVCVIFMAKVVDPADIAN